MTDTQYQTFPGDITSSWEALREALDQLGDDLDELSERADLVAGVASKAMISNSVTTLEGTLETVLDRLDDVGVLLGLEEEEEEDD